MERSTGLGTVPAPQLRLRRLDEQCVVITGASSGIGLTTARMAARAGAAVVLASRNERALQRAAQDIRASGGSAVAVVADVASEADVEHVADVAEREFGRIDSWVNNASVNVYGRLTEVSTADARRVLDVGFWGVVHGCQTAVPRLREHGGAIVTVGGVLSDRALPLQGVPAAAKHAVKGYLDALRMELAHARLPIAVSLVKPSSVDTPLLRHARNYMDVQPAAYGPAQPPEAVAAAVLRCATFPTRDAYVGQGARTLALLGTLFPTLTDRYMERALFDAQRSERPAPNGARDNLHAVLDDEGVEHGENGIRREPVQERSRVRITSHPRAAAVGMAGLGLAMAAGIRLLRARA